MSSLSRGDGTTLTQGGRPHGKPAAAELRGGEAGAPSLPRGRRGARAGEAGRVRSVRADRRGETRFTGPGCGRGAARAAPHWVRLCGHGRCRQRRGRSRQPRRPGLENKPVDAGGSPPPNPVTLRGAKSSSPPLCRRLYSSYKYFLTQEPSTPGRAQVWFLVPEIRSRGFLVQLISFVCFPGTMLLIIYRVVYIFF